ncbi:hypothetical protein [Mycobacterium shigaense]|uniref:Uncharacterized protein n=1 Tax=Mycobacterium shigaense TaxID=722731 RepID=A0A1Z4EFF9_9MYCO|nr:hypothetical protein [Mycobacterium shigaense]MEA1124767.1 hypothetical protein [Mycobacterium shigaense]PRI16419.1 hypothetical protein B2J96_06470 [Mycobacterium shigaense]BAX91686.1 hypothetical protein MSG_01530 [Mycobacterium shigaense]
MRASTLPSATAAVATASVAGGQATLPAASSVDLARRAIASRGGRAGVPARYPACVAFAFLLSTHIWLLNHRIDAP